MIAGKNKGIAASDKDNYGDNIVSEKLKPRKGLKPILQKLSERKPLPIHYIGTSYGVTKELFGFWRKNQLRPVYLR